MSNEYFIMSRNVLLIISLLVGTSWALSWTNLKPLHRSKSGVLTPEKLDTEYIIGGDFAAVGQFPYQIALRIDDAYFCGGSLILDNTVLTAAHCVKGNPTPGAYGYGVSWRPYSPSEGNFFALEAQQTKIQPIPSLGEAFWNSLLPKLDALSLAVEDKSRKSVSEGGELKLDGSTSTYRSTTFALGGVAIVLATLLALSLVLLRRRSSRDAAEDAF